MELEEDKATPSLAIWGQLRAAHLAQALVIMDLSQQLLILTKVPKIQSMFTSLDKV